MEYTISRADEMYHYGIKGQKWGVRRYENEDGTLTEEGRARYRADAEKARKEIGDASRNIRSSVGTNEATSMRNALFSGQKYRQLDRTVNKAVKKEMREYGRTYDEKREAAKEYSRRDEDRDFLNDYFTAKAGRKKRFVR